MAQPTLYLMDSNGQAVGPVSQRAAEALFASRVISMETPVSREGSKFQTLGDFPDLKLRMLQIMKCLADEVDPWERSSPEETTPEPPVRRAVPRSPTPVPMATAIPTSGATPRPRNQSSFEPVPGANPRPRSASSLETAPTASTSEGQTVLKVLFRHAAARSKGILSLSSSAGDLQIGYTDGKIVTFDTITAKLGLPEFLTRAKVCDVAGISKAREAAPNFGGDLGAALVSLGIVPPHIFMQQLPNWVRGSLVEAAQWREFSSEFNPSEIPTPPIPLGLDRFRIFSELLEKIDRETMNGWLEPKLNVPVIRSFVEGADLDQIGLDPKTFRTSKAIDGTKTTDEILKAAGTKLDQQVAAIRALYFTTQVGLAVFGEDQRTPEEQRQARRLEELREKFENATHFEILGVTASSTDEEVSAKYKEAAKKYHPDTLRDGTLPELAEVRTKLFEIYRRSYDALKDAKKRESYQKLIDQGYDHTKDEQEIVRNVLQAEVEFKKAEALLRMRKFPEALDVIRAAEKMKPDDAELKIYHAYLRVMSEKKPISATIQKAIEDIRAQLKLNANLLSGFVFLARLYKLDEQAGKALKAWKIVLEMDPKNTEANSELRLMRMREEKGKKGLFGL